MQRSDLRSQFSKVDTSLVTPIPRGCNPTWLFTFFTSFSLALAMGQFASASDPDNVLLDFTATWCGPCQQMSSIVSRLERQGYSIRKVDVDHEPALASKYRVQSIPCFVLVAKGEEIDRVTGSTTENQLRSMLNRLPKPAPVAKTAPDNRRNESEPSLGSAVAMTNPAGGTPPRRSLPASFNTPEKEKEQAPPADPEAEGTIWRGQSPEINPMRSSVRIRVTDGKSINYGSGTIIDSQNGQSTILTCGHIFRGLSKSAVVEIDLFLGAKGSKPETLTGQVLLTDMAADVGLVTVKSSKRLPAVPLGQPSQQLAKNEKLFSIGCSSGNIPTREDLQLTGINKYDGPDNLECTTRPVQGRSGGGLFRDDELIGVCVAADPTTPRGIYTGLQPINLLLDKAGLQHLLPRSPLQPTNTAIADNTRTAEVPAGPFTRTETTMTEAELTRLLANGADGNGSDASNAQDFAGAEIVCIVRSRTPGKPVRVVIVNQASERFVADLLNESTGDAGRMTADHGPAMRGEAGNVRSRPVETSFEPKPYRRQSPK